MESDSWLDLNYSGSPTEYRDPDTGDIKERDVPSRHYHYIVSKDGTILHATDCVMVRMTEFQANQYLDDCSDNERYDQIRAKHPHAYLGWVE